MVRDVHDAFGRQGRLEDLVTALADPDQALAGCKQRFLVLRLDGNQGFFRFVAGFEC